MNIFKAIQGYSSLFKGIPGYFPKFFSWNWGALGVGWLLGMVAGFLHHNISGWRWKWATTHGVFLPIFPVNKHCENRRFRYPFGRLVSAAFLPLRDSFYAN